MDKLPSDPAEFARGLSDLPKAPPILPVNQRGRGLKIALFTGIPVLAAFLIGLVVVVAPKLGSRMDVGSCVQGQVDDADSIHTVTCGPDAKYKVVGKVADQSQIALRISASVCDPFPTADAIFWQGARSGTGTAFCLEDLKTPGERMPLVGDCLKGDAVESQKTEKAPCGEAGYKVVAVEAGSAFGFGGDSCVQAPTAGAAVRWKRTGTAALPQEKVLCLEDLKNPGHRRPVVGGCLNLQDKSLTVLDCGAGARYKVVGKVEGVTQIDGLTDPIAKNCPSMPTATDAVWYGMGSALSGTRYCLEPVRK
ncbi:hypothetical protein [Amycolatopsis sp. NPDC059021]|uniref:LppU/SCO3897 family protein n=1 Tax=Amycolatopsis sp. NPDC059021 TaxID=3346704 RepID=UPI00367041D0